MAVVALRVRAAAIAVVAVQVDAVVRLLRAMARPIQRRVPLMRKATNPVAPGVRVVVAGNRAGVAKALHHKDKALPLKARSCPFTHPSL